MGAFAFAPAQQATGTPGVVRRAREGDFAAFEELYRRNVGRVYGICLRLTADPAVAEELTQQAFVRAWRKLGSFRGDVEFPAWLGRLAVNVVLGERRQRNRRRERAFDDDAAAAEPETRAEPHEALDLERAIAALPDRARAVFVLHDVEGYHHEEIGRALGIASGTSKAQLHRARRLLREALR